MKFNIDNWPGLAFGIIAILAWSIVNIFSLIKSSNVQKEQNKLTANLQKEQNRLNDKMIDNQLQQATLQSETQKAINEQNVQIQKLIENNKFKNNIESQKHEIEMKKLNQTTAIYSSLISDIEKSFNEFIDVVQKELSSITLDEYYQGHSFSQEWRKAKNNLIKYLPSAFKIINDFEKHFVERSEIYIELQYADNEKPQKNFFNYVISSKISNLIAELRQAILEIQLDSN